MPLHLRLVDPGPERQVDLDGLPSDGAWSLTFWPGIGYSATLWDQGRLLLDSGTTATPQQAIDELVQLRQAHATIAAAGAGGQPPDPAPRWTWQELAASTGAIALLAASIWLALS